MVDRKNIKLNIGAITKVLEMLRFLPDHFKTKTMCKYAEKNLPFLTKYIPNRYKTQGMRDKVIPENVGMLMFIPDCYMD